MDKMVGLNPCTPFWDVGPCPNCKANLWEWDDRTWVKHHRERYTCFYCGQDEWPGGAITYKAMGLEDTAARGCGETEVGASSSASGIPNTTEGGRGDQ